MGQTFPKMWFTKDTQYLLVVPSKLSKHLPYKGGAVLQMEKDSLLLFVFVCVFFSVPFVYSFGFSLWTLLPALAHVQPIGHVGRSIKSSNPPTA